MEPAKIVAFIGLSTQFLTLVSGHGRLLEPPNRSSLWRFTEFTHLEPEINFETDNALYCGNYTVQWEFNGGKCGVCGDPFNDPTPRDNEDDGLYAKGIIVRGYRSGQVMPVEVELTASHKGYFEFRLCAKDNKESHWNQECYDEHLLELADGSGTKYFVPANYGEHYARYNLTLPKGVSCQHCVLQWHYYTGNFWGTCENGTEAMGCGKQETFRGCSDIIIYPENATDFNPAPNSNYGQPPLPGVTEDQLRGRRN